jgi:large conductance mechanosensitive channel
MIKGFKEFLFRGNVIDLAVAVVIGAAFGAVITAVVDGLINPLIAAIFGQPNLGETWTFELNGAVFSIGLILDAVINFVLVAAAIYFVIIVPMNRLMSMRRRPEEAPVAVTPEEIVLLREIRDSLARRP